MQSDHSMRSCACRSTKRWGLAHVAVALALWLAAAQAGAQVLSPVQVVRESAYGIDGLFNVSNIDISSDGKHVYAVSSVDHAVAVFSRTAASGALTFVEVERDGVAGVQGLRMASAVAVAPDGNHVYVTGTDPGTVAVFARNSTTGALSFVEHETDNSGGANGLLGAVAVAVSPDNAHVYVAGRDEDTITVFSRNGGTGALTFASAVVNNAGGVTGMNRIQDVIVASNGSHVYAVSDFDDTVVAFSRNAGTGALTFIEKEQNGVGGVIGLNGATSLVAAGSHLYVASVDNDAVAVFNRNTGTGALTFSTFLQDGSGGVSGLNGARDIRVAPDGTHVYVASEGDASIGAVAVFARNTTTGALAFTGTTVNGVGGIQALAQPKALVISPDSNHVYVASTSDHAVTALLRNTSTGALSYINSYADAVGLQAPLVLDVAPDGEDVYVTDSTDNAVSQFRRAAVSGELTYGASLQDGSNGVEGLLFALGIAVAPDNKHVYTTGRVDDAVSVFSRNSTTGALTFVESHRDDNQGGALDGLDGASSVVVSPDGNFVYVGSSFDAAVVVFSRNTTTGALTFEQMAQHGSDGITGLGLISAITLSPDGAHLFAVGTFEGTLVVFERDAVTGHLTFLEVFRDATNSNPAGFQGLGSPTSVKVSPDGATVYVASLGDNAVSIFARDATTGLLTYLGLIQDGAGGITTLDGARSVAISGDGSRVYVASQVDHALTVFDRDQSTGSLSFAEAHVNGVGGIDGLGGASFVTESPDGMHVYVTGTTTGSVVVFERVDYAISGLIRTAGGTGISGVALTGLPGNPITDDTGFYVGFVPNDWSGTATPSRVGYTFTPTSRAYDNVMGDQPDQDYTGAIIAEPALSVTPSNRSVGSTAGNTTFTVTNAGSGTLNWTASVIAGSDWLSVVPASGSRASQQSEDVNGSFNQNNATSPRTGTIRFTAAGAVGSPVDVTVMQAGAEPAPALAVTPSNRDVGAGSGSTSFAVQNAGGGTLNWSASVTSGADWLSVSPESGSRAAGQSQSVTATFSTNSAANPRTGTIRFTAAGAVGSPVDITVTQAGAVPALSVTPGSRSVGSGAGSTTFTVTNTGSGTLNWSASVLPGASWLTISPASGARASGQSAIVTASHTANSATSPRTGTIRFTAAGAEGSPVDVTVTQGGTDPVPALSVSPSNRNVTSEVGTTSFTVTNTGDGTLSWSASVVAGGSWLSIAPASGTRTAGQSQNVTASVAANTSTSPRSGTVRFTAAGASGSPRDVTVTQAGTDPVPVLSVNPTHREVGAAAGNTSFTVTNAGDGTLNWTASVVSGASWLSIAPSSGSRTEGLSQEVTASHTANTSVDLRTGTIRFTAAGAQGSPMDVTVTQSGTEPVRVLSVTPATRDVTSAAGSTTFTVTNAGEGTMTWSAVVASGSEWLSISPASGSRGAGQSQAITATHTANTSASVRTGTIRVTAEGAQGSPIEVTVTQAGTDPVPVLSVSPSSRNVAMAAGSASFTVTNNGQGTLNWVASVTSGSDWLSVAPTGGATGAGLSETVTASFTANASPAIRTGTIRYTATGAQGSPVTVTVTQAGTNPVPVLEVSPSSRSIAATAGNTSFTVTNGGDGTLNWSASVVSGGSWLSVSPASGSRGAGQSESVTATFAANTATSSRTGTIRFTASGAQGSPVDVTVVQAGATGGTGCFKSMVEPKIREQALPHGSVPSSDTLALRLTADAPIDAASIYAVVYGEGWAEVGGVFRATSVDDMSDGWVVFTPQVDWPVGEEIALEVTARTITGDDIGPMSRTFIVTDGAPGDSKAYVEQMTEDGLPELPAKAASAAYRLGPDGVFDTALTVLIPLSEDAELDDLEIYYFSESEEHEGWYRAENVLGWLASRDVMIVQEDGQVYLEFEVNHSGVVQVGYVQDVHSGDVALLLTVLVAVGAIGSRRRGTRDRR